MSRAAFSLWVFSIYLWALGLLLIFDPNLLRIVGIPESHEVWIRVVGLLVVIIGCVDFVAAREELLPILRGSVPIRLLVLVVFAAFVILRLAPPALLLFGLVDAAGALWTGICLRLDAAAERSVQDRQPEQLRARQP